MVIPAQFLNQNFHEIFVYHFLKMKGNEYRPFTERLKEKGKKSKVIVVAVMHKILRIVFAILKKGVPFDEAALI
ncbi:MAG: hypothetical protein CNLJKLNK_00243 [Holosporales bacterium]